MKDPSLARRALDRKLDQCRFSPEDRRRIERARDLLQAGRFADGKKNYAAHPMRVALHILRYEPAVEADIIVLALLHNIFEGSDVLPDHICAELGEAMRARCLALKVNRARQGEESYLREFYDQFKNDRGLLLIKIFDKWDNMLSLYFNPSAEVRRRYLDEIENWLLPIIGPHDTSARSALASLIEETRFAPPVSLDEFLARASS